MSSASEPPINMKNSAAAPYMMPIFLWSTVVNHDFHPVMAVGRSKMPMGWKSSVVSPDGKASVGRGSVSAIGQFLLERLKVGDELIDLILGQAQVGHASLLGRTPSASRPGGLRNHASSDGRLK